MFDNKKIFVVLSFVVLFLLTANAVFADSGSGTFKDFGF